MTKDPRKARGDAGERAACHYLIQKGYVIRNVKWRCRIGEIDIVASHGGVIAFVEVRSRSERSLGAFGTAFESVTPKKQQTVRRVAELYLQRFSEATSTVRFDCISVVLNELNEPVSIHHLPNAF